MVNLKVPRLFFAGDIGDIQRLLVLYASKCKVPNERGKEKVWRGFVGRYWDLKQNLCSPPKQFVKFKCQI